MNQRMLVLNSGGRTSAYMTERLLKEYSNDYEMVICFANTGWEHEKTLEFVNKCGARWSLLYNAEIIWIEAVTNSGRSACSHKIVNFKTAARNQEPFVEVIKKYGIPNKGYPHCTRELKENPIHSFIRSIGWKKGEYLTAIGIRSDESFRITRKVSVQNKQIKFYPLVDLFMTDKLDVLNFWESQEFNLEIPEYLGNCVGCYRKSINKLKLVYKSDNEHFDFPIKMERNHGFIGNNKIKGVSVDEQRRFYRGNISARDMIAIFSWSEESREPKQEEFSFCSESCEPFI